MTKSRKTAVALVVASVVFVVVAAVVWSRHRGSGSGSVEHPASIVGVTDGGELTLQTQEGEVRGRLAEVQWLSDAAFVREARQAIEKASGRELDWGRDEAGLLYVGYLAEDGERVSLNDEVARIARRHGQQ